MLEIGINNNNVAIKGSGEIEELVTDATFAVLSIAKDMSERLQLPFDVAFAKLFVTASSAIDGFSIEVMKSERVNIPDLKKFLDEEKRHD